MEFLVIAILALACGFVLGGLVTGHQARLYQGRWKEALKLLESLQGETPKSLPVKPTAALPAAPPPPPKPKGAYNDIPLKELYRLPPSYRAKIEIDRLKRGLPPRDDLMGLPPSYVTDIILERQKRAL